MTRKTVLILVAITVFVFLVLPLGIYGYQKWRTARRVRELNEQTAVINKVIAEQLAGMTQGQLQQYLASLYEDAVKKANPQLNGLRVSVEVFGNGQDYSLFAEHAFLGKYSLQYGDTGKIIKQWIEENQHELRRAGIFQVGVRGSDRYSDYDYFQLKR